MPRKYKKVQKLRSEIWRLTEEHAAHRQVAKKLGGGERCFLQTEKVTAELQLHSDPGSFQV